MQTVQPRAFLRAGGSAVRQLRTRSVFFILVYFISYCDSLYTGRQVRSKLWIHQLHAVPAWVVRQLPWHGAVHQVLAGDVLQCNRGSVVDGVRRLPSRDLCQRDGIHGVPALQLGAVLGADGVERVHALCKGVCNCFRGLRDFGNVCVFVCVCCSNKGFLNIHKHVAWQVHCKKAYP